MFKRSPITCIWYQKFYESCVLEYLQKCDSLPVHPPSEDVRQHDIRYLWLRRLSTPPYIAPPYYSCYHPRIPSFENRPGNFYHFYHNYKDPKIRWKEASKYYRKLTLNGSRSTDNSDHSTGIYFWVWNLV